MACHANYTHAVGPHGMNQKRKKCLSPNDLTSFFFLFFLQQRYGHNPLNLYTTIRACLHAEMNLVQRAEQVILLL